MGYKILGFIVWQGGKLFLRRRTEGAARKAALAGLAGLVVGGMIVAQRQHSCD
jgi:hypothetical protein